MLYTAVCKAYGDRGQYEEATAIFNDMSRRGIPLDSLIFTYMITLAGKVRGRGDVDARSARARPADPLVGANTQMRTHAQTGRVERAFDLYDDMVARGLTPMESTMKMLVYAACRRKGPRALPRSVARTSTPCLGV